MKKNLYPTKKQRTIYEEEASMYLAALLKQGHPFKFSEKTGRGAIGDPYMRTVDYFSTEDEEKEIDIFLSKMREIRKNYR